MVSLRVERDCSEGLGVFGVTFFCACRSLACSMFLGSMGLRFARVGFRTRAGNLWGLRHQHGLGVDQG